MWVQFISLAFWWDPLTIGNQYKRRKIDESGGGGGSLIAANRAAKEQQQQQEKILQYLQRTNAQGGLNAADNDDVVMEPEVYDLDWLENLSKELKTTVQQNFDVRIKYSNDPLKWVVSI